MGVRPQARGRRRQNRNAREYARKGIRHAYSNAIGGTRNPAWALRVLLAVFQGRGVTGARRNSSLPILYLTFPPGRNFSPPLSSACPANGKPKLWRESNTPLSGLEVRSLPSCPEERTVRCLFDGKVRNRRKITFPLSRPSREGGNPGPNRQSLRNRWIPAFAGRTALRNTNVNAILRRLLSGTAAGH